MSDLKLGGGIVITIILLLSGTYEYSREKTFFCPDSSKIREEWRVTECERISGTNKTCYPNLLDDLGKKVCYKGWVNICEILKYEDSKAGVIDFGGLNAKKIGFN